MYIIFFNFVRNLVALLIQTLRVGFLKNENDIESSIDKWDLLL